MCENAEIETENRESNILQLTNFGRRRECFVKVLEHFLHGIIASKKDITVIILQSHLAIYL